MSYSAKLRGVYKDEIAPALMKEFGYKSIMQVPKIEKICINQGVGNAVSDKKLIEAAVNEMTMITGQKAVPTYSKKDISNFKLRKGMPVGARVTLRGDQMYEFLERLISVALPRTRDFRGVKATGFDKSGNFSFGIEEQIIFPEIDIDKVNNVTGMDVTFVTNSSTKEETKALLEGFGFPFAKN